MNESHPPKPPLSVEQLSKRSNFSTATIWRLKKAGKIPFYQPGGKGHKVCFPPDALDHIEQLFPPNEDTAPKIDKLSGPSPEWMRKTKPKK